MARSLRIGNHHGWASTPAPVFGPSVPATYNLAQNVYNPKNKTLTYAVVGSLPSGATLSGSIITWTGFGTPSFTTCRFSVTFAGVTQTSPNATVVILNADTTAPTVPTGVTATPVSSSQINISWTAATDPNVGGAITTGVTDCRVYRNNTHVGTVTAPQTTFPDSGLSPATQYSYTVSARDLVGNESAQSSPPVLATTQGTAPVGLIAPTRRIDWSGAGATIVNRTSVFQTIAAYTGTAATINTAIQNCSNAGGGVVALGAGTFNLSTTIQMRSNVTLRGASVNTTILNFTAVGGSGFFYGQATTALVFQGNFNSSGYTLNPSWGGAPASNIKTWTGCGGASGSYPQGATVLNLGSAPTGSPNLAVGDMLTLWQVDDADASVPKAGYLVSKKTAASGSNQGISWQGSGESRTSSQQQRVRVAAISGNDVTISPGLFLPAGTWRTDRSPQVAWQGGDIRSAGLEDLTIRTTGVSGDVWSTVQFWQASDCWVTRCRIEPKFSGFHAGGASFTVVHYFECRNCTVRDTWMTRAMGGGHGSTTTYGHAFYHASNCLCENNICFEVESPFMVNPGATGNVIAYNYEIKGAQQEAGVQFHEVGSSMNLIEGNRVHKVMGDVFHGNSNFQTIYRNHTVATEAGIDLWSYHRFWNILGNVVAATNRYKTLITDATLFDRFSGSALRLGYNSGLATNNPDPINGSDVGVGPDIAVANTALLWGNYTAANGTATFSALEVPTADAFYPNQVPPDNTLPTSLFRSSRPSYFTFNGTTVAWPPIGPDVTGGTEQGGRAHKLPAQLAYENAAGNPANFNPSLYGFSPPGGGTVTAANATQAAVQAAVNSAVDGDTVLIPNGSASWSGGISTTKQIRIRAQNYTATPAGTAGTGATTRNVTITNNSPDPLFELTSGNSFHVGVAGIAFLEGTGSGADIYLHGNGSKVPLVNDCYFQVKVRNWPVEPVVYSACKGGVFWNCVFDATATRDFDGTVGSNQSTWVIKSEGGSGARLWTTASTMGTLDTNGDINTYCEDTTFLQCGQCPDIDDHGRWVARRCRYNGSWAVSHGQTSLWGARHTEFYDNIFESTVNFAPWRNMGRYTWTRGGTGIWTNNVVNEAAAPGAYGPIRELDFGDNEAPNGPYLNPRQPGCGHNGTAYVSDPMYAWNETGAKAYSFGIQSGWGTLVQQNRDFFLNAGAKPGYTKFTYPHPLRSA